MLKVQLCAVNCKISLVQRSAVKCSAVKCSAVHYSAVQCIEVQCSAVQYSIVQCCLTVWDLGRLQQEIVCLCMTRLIECSDSEVKF